MTDAVGRATQTQMENLQTRAGKTLDELYAVVRASGLNKHGAIRDMLKTTLGMGHGDANMLAHLYLSQVTDAGDERAVDDPLDALYAGSKAPLRPLHEAVMAQIETLGEFQVAPKKAYLSLRRTRQFAMVGPGTRGRLEIGLNVRDLADNDRLVVQPAGGMCPYKVWLTSPDEVDAELLGWLRAAYEAAG